MIKIKKYLLKIYLYDSGFHLIDQKIIAYNAWDWAQAIWNDI